MAAAVAKTTSTSARQSDDKDMSMGGRTTTWLDRPAIWPAST